MLPSLLDQFKEDFPGVKRSVLRNIWLLVVCMLQRETVNLYKLKKQVGPVLGNTKSKPAAHYKRLLRLFQQEKESDLWQFLLLFCLRLFRLKVEYLLLDGTSWQFGKQKLHFLVLSMVYQGVAIPLCWSNLAKKGTSSVEERKELLQKAQGLYHLSGKVLVADREYIGPEWFKALQEAGLHWVVRLRKNLYRAAIDQAPGGRYSKLVKKAKSRKRAVSKKIKLEGLDLTFVVIANRQAQAKEELLYLLSSLEDALVISQAYRLRWLIEYCFKHMKSNGFDVEDLSFTDKDKIRLLWSALIVAYCWSIHQGLKFDQTVKRKKYANQTTARAVSVFRNGLDHLSSQIYQLAFFLDFIFKEMACSKVSYRSKKAIFVQ